MLRFGTRPPVPDSNYRKFEVNLIHFNSYQRVLFTRKQSNPIDKKKCKIMDDLTAPSTPEQCPGDFVLDENILCLLNSVGDIEPPEDPMLIVKFQEPFFRVSEMV